MTCPYPALSLKTPLLLPPLSVPTTTPVSGHQHLWPALVAFRPTAHPLPFRSSQRGLCRAQVCSHYSRQMPNQTLPLSGQCPTLHMVTQSLTPASTFISAVLLTGCPEATPSLWLSPFQLCSVLGHVLAIQLPCCHVILPARLQGTGVGAGISTQTLAPEHRGI